MELNYSNQQIKTNKKSIFLAGPVPRNSSVESWRNEAIDILKKYNFNGLVYIPECEKFHNIEGDIDQMLWDREALTNATAILMWIPRNMKTMPALTSNIEFGYYLNSGKFFYGRPNDSEYNEYLDWLYKYDLKKEPKDDLNELVKEVINFVNKEG